MRLRRLVLAPLLMAAVVVGVAPSAPAAPAANHTVTFVNQSGQTLWLGSGVNADGSVNFAHLPTLAKGQSATVTIPEDKAPNHWRGRFFARQGCTGSGTSFHCLDGDCGATADHCAGAQQPVSLAEFNFDRNDKAAPWYNVSYVDAFSLPITIAPNNAPPPPSGGGPCQLMGCPGDMLQYCPPADLKKNPNTGAPLVCVNPNRDAQTDYSKAMSAHCPYAYSWSKGDTTSGNQVVRNCSKCSGLTVTFH